MRTFNQTGRRVSRPCDGTMVVSVKGFVHRAGFVRERIF